MNRPFAPPSQCVRLSAPDDFEGWRLAARSLIARHIPPDRVTWHVAGEAEAGLFDEPALAIDDEAPPFPVARDLVRLLRTALLHSDPGRFGLGYRLLWRSRGELRLHLDAADPDMMALGALAKAVRRDIHKMHAFVRFRKTGEVDGRECFAAWFEPQHHITRAVAGFFRNRFAGMNWLIVTPEASIAWDGRQLTEGPGGCRGDVPDGDEVEAEWRAYYANIFNPARLKVNAMKREMPVRYWRNLPEAALIGDLVEASQRRVADMIAQANAGLPLFEDAPAHDPDPTEPRFASLDALYAALRRDDVPPSPGFSDRIVVGEGPADARIMLVGEQPGDVEDEEDRPFVGPAGQMLDRCLAEAGGDRSRLFLTNAVKRFKFSPRGKRRVHQTPTAGDVAHYRWWLEREIALVNPAVVVSLGATALLALTARRHKLAAVRGTPTAWQGRTLLATVHPSFLLRLPDEQARTIERAKFVTDLGHALGAAA